jgi:hypothetical protein
MADNRLHRQLKNSAVRLAAATDIRYLVPVRELRAIEDQGRKFRIQRARPF